MTGPGIYTTHPICPDCYQVVKCEVAVTGDGDTHILSGPDEHRLICKGKP
jgi:hypothetical protein